MVLPEKVIERLGREPTRTPGWSGRIIMLSGIILAATLLLYFGLSYGWRPFLESELNKMNDTIQKFSQEVPVSDQAELTTFYSQLANIQALLKNHLTVSPLFLWLERFTHPNVYFSKLSLNTVSRQMGLAGVARSSSDVTEQIVVLEAQPEIETVRVGNMSLGGEGLWRFDFTIVFRPNFFIQPISQL